MTVVKGRGARAGARRVPRGTPEVDFLVPAAITDAAQVTVRATTPEQALEKFLAGDWQDLTRIEMRDWHATGPVRRP